MKEIIIYNNHYANLSSIKPVEYNYSDKVYMFDLIEKFFALTKGALFVYARIHNYYLSDSVLTQIKQMDNSVTSGKKLSEISFTLKNKLDENSLEMLFEIWFAYEQVVFCFLTNDEVESIEPNSAWYDITSATTCFGMFKGMEEDVVWIGKSSNLTFPYPYSTIIG